MFFSTLDGKIDKAFKSANSINYIEQLEILKKYILS